MEKCFQIGELLEGIDFLSGKLQKILKAISRLF